MNKLDRYTDPFETATSQYNVASYLIKSEVDDFVASECPENHIFVDAVMVANFVELDRHSNPHKIYDLTKVLIDEFDEYKADELIHLVNEIPTDITELFQYFNNE